MSMWRKVLLGLGGLMGVAFVGVAGLVGFAAVTADSMLQYPDWPAPDVKASTDPDVIARGKYLAHGPAHCATCHGGSTNRDDPASILNVTNLDGGLDFAMGPIGTRYARNLTPDPETGIGRFSDAEIARAIRSGVLPSGELSIFMALSQGNYSDEDVAAIVSYLRSLPPVKKEVPPGEYYIMAKVFLRYGLFGFDPRPVEGPSGVQAAAEPTVERGQYLAENAAFCRGCHTPYDPATFTPNGPAFSGGTPEASHGEDHDFEFAPPNLTSASVGYTGRTTEDAFVARFKSAGRAHKSSIMPWESYSTMTENDLRSIYRYLRTVPPVEVDTGPPYRKIGSWKQGS